MTSFSKDHFYSGHRKLFSAQGKVSVYFFFYCNLKELRIGVVQDFTVMLTVANKAEDSAYYSQISLKVPADLDYIGPIQVKLKAP